MTSQTIRLTPFRLFQIAKYALNHFTKTASTSLHARSRARSRIGAAVAPSSADERRGWATRPPFEQGNYVAGTRTGDQKFINSGYIVSSRGSESSSASGSSSSTSSSNTEESSRFDLPPGYPLSSSRSGPSSTFSESAPQTSDSSRPSHSRDGAHLSSDTFNQSPSSSSSPPSSSSSGGRPSPRPPNRDEDDDGARTTTSPSVKSRHKVQVPAEDGRNGRYNSEIARLMADSTLFTPSFLPPRNVVVLCHGLYGFSTATPIPIFPSLKLHYWHAVLEALRDRLGCKILVVGVKGTGSIEERARQMHEYLREKLPVGTGVNFVAHSMGGLDCRYLISHIKPETYKPVSLTMIGTPNRGSPFMDWCAANIGVGTPRSMKPLSNSSSHATPSPVKNGDNKLPPYSLKAPLLAREKKESSSDGSSSFGNSLTDYLLGLLDSPAYGNLTTHYLRGVFNPATPDDPNVKYTSTAGRVARLSVLHPLWFPKLILDAAAERGYAEEEGKSGKDYEGNDGLVSVSSAKWGEWLGVVENTHHWDLRGEGGLFPQGGKIGDWPEPDLKDLQSERRLKPIEPPTAVDPAAWAQAVKEGGAKAGIAAMEVLRRGAESVAEAGMNVKDKVQPNTKSNSKEDNSAWDLSEVSQIIDWVSDLIPFTGNPEGEKDKVGFKQLADAAKEKASEQGIRDTAQYGDMRKTDDVGPRIASKEEQSAKKDKFDLGRFYGGLMVKIREDGF